MGMFMDKLEALSSLFCSEKYQSLPFEMTKFKVDVGYCLSLSTMFVSHTNPTN